MFAASMFAVALPAQVTPLWQYSETGTTVGASVDAGHDVNGDGVPDVIVGIPRGGLTGRARVLSGATGAVIHDLSFWLSSPTNQSRFGLAVALLGDLNDDGRSEFAVGGPTFDSSAGSVGIFSGSDASLILRVDAPTGFAARMGEHIERLGDLDGDGKSEFAVGEVTSGSVRLSKIYSGATLTVLQTLTGLAFAGGDLDGDGREDVLCLVQGVGVEARRGSDLAVLHTASIATPSTATATIGDIDGDGRDDFAVASNLNPFTNQIAVTVFRGADGSLVNTSATAGAFSGFYDLIGVGDIDGDCVGDYALCIGSAALGDGLTEFRSGATHAVITSYVMPSSENYDQGIATLGDLDGDGYPEVAIGHSANPTLPQTSPVGILQVVDLGLTAPLASLRAIGSACVGSAGNLALSSASGCPRVGTSMALIVRNALPNAALVQNLGMSTNQPLDSAGMPGCVLLATGDGFNLFGMADANGTATSASFTVPNDVALLGVQLASQAICVDAAANAVGLTTSRGLLITIGS
jgi:hypothetical protein